ncbi:MAG: hypothetical protein IRY99_19455, partial [Isosphaeraceae bacterium]|nr:hypothetical protein [Isosphaeraceae bacterium]
METNSLDAAIWERLSTLERENLRLKWTGTLVAAGLALMILVGMGRGQGSKRV